MGTKETRKAKMNGMAKIVIATMIMAAIMAIVKPGHQHLTNDSQIVKPGHINYRG